MLSTDNEFKSMSCNKLVGLSEVHVEGDCMVYNKGLQL